MPWTLTSRFWFRRWFPVCSDQEAVTASMRPAGSYPHALVLPLPPLYTCRSLVIEQANQVRTPDITCVPMAPGLGVLGGDAGLSEPLGADPDGDRLGR
jgi:hypothetical protein